MSNTDGCPLPSHLMANIEEAIVHTRAEMERHEALLDALWAKLSLLAKIKSSGAMTITQRDQLADWFVQS